MPVRCVQPTNQEVAVGMRGRTVTVGLDFNNTCPVIDDQIAQFQQVVKHRLADLIETVSPYTSAEKREELATDHMQWIFSDCEPLFETLRQTNSDMRKQAERQLSDLGDRVAELEVQVDELESKV